jgi:hypothetical protein
MILARQDGLDACRAQAATMLSSSAATTQRAAPARARAGPRHHRQAGNIGQRFAGQTGRGQTGRDQYRIAHDLLLFFFQLVVGQGAGFVFQQHRMPSRTGRARRALWLISS